MKRNDAFEDLAEKIICITVSPEDLERWGFALKPGKTWGDLKAACSLQPGQRPGDFDVMTAHIEKNIKEILDYRG